MAHERVSFTSVYAQGGTDGGADGGEGGESGVGVGGGGDGGWNCTTKDLVLRLPLAREKVKEGGGESGSGGDCLDEAGAAAEPAALSSMQRAASTLSRRVPFILVSVAFFFSCKRLSCHG